MRRGDWMGIAPIDLQTLFTQLDKVGKAYTSLKEGQVIQEAIQGIQIQKKAEEQVQHVNETQNTGDGVEKVNDRGQRNQRKGAKKENPQKEDDSEEEEKRPFVFSDPNLGNKIDISL